ncbi:MAG TPA: 4-hydroxythreonine-4-phosphate dehydrogenase PdxA, partial [Bacteroidetes bacterium]|nr:4-hydroxythreonine-4-phosphate dehydrogenase PdxA [Bacteroidota bacterium]
MGDPNGVGPEVLLKILKDGQAQQLCSIEVVGQPSVLDYYRDQLNLAVKNVQITPIEASDFHPHPGRIGREAGDIAMKSVALAVDMCLDGRADAMVTCPISKEAISLAGHHFPGHTEYIADRTKSEHYQMMMVSDHLRVGLVSGHVPLNRVGEEVTREAIREALDIMVASLHRDFGLQSPHIAVLGLNPHAGD